jgi:hypothetical protein
VHLLSAAELTQADANRTRFEILKGGLAMPDTAKRDQLEALKQTLESIAASSRDGTSALSRAILDLVIAADYADKALLESSLNSVLSCVADLARDLIQSMIATTEQTKAAIRQYWREKVDCVANEDFDELKNGIESIIDMRISSMSNARDELVKKFEEKGYKVENAGQLEDSIRNLRQFRQDILKEWPLPSKSPSPLNRQAIAEARAAIARGEKGLRKDELIWGQSKKCGG